MTAEYSHGDEPLISIFACQERRMDFAYGSSPGVPGIC